MVRDENTEPVCKQDTVINKCYLFKLYLESASADNDRMEWISQANSVKWHPQANPNE